MSCWTRKPDSTPPVWGRLNAVLEAGNASTISASESRPSNYRILKGKDETPTLAKATLPARELQFYTHLLEKNVPKDPTCGQSTCGQSTDESNSNGKRGRCPYVECGYDGYLMDIHVNPLTVLFLSSTQRDQNIAPWQKFKSSGVNARQIELGQLERARVLLKNDAVCTFGTYDPLKKNKIWKIPVAMFKKLSNTAFSYELLQISDYYYIDPVIDTVAFVSMVQTKERAGQLGLPWSEGGQPYLYLVLLCSKSRGGGQAMLPRLFHLCHELHVDRIVLSSLGHVVWYYYTQWGARFIDRRGGRVDVGPFVEDMPDPVSPFGVK